MCFLQHQLIHLELNIFYKIFANCRYSRKHCLIQIFKKYKNYKNQVFFINKIVRHQTSFTKPPGVMDSYAKTLSQINKSYEKIGL